MKINIVAVGGIKDKFYAEACGEYIKRLQRFCDISVIETPESTAAGEPDEIGKAAILKKEAEKYKKHLKGFVIVADIDGKLIDSKGFSEILSRKKSEGVSEFTFLIGGSYGVDKAVKDAADFRLSFSPMTFPHRLFRVMLLEQIYRAFTIENNTPYHK